MALYDGERPAVDYKHDKSPLTQADIDSQSIVLTGLARLTPDWPILSEESAESPFDQRSACGHFWMVAPWPAQRSVSTVLASSPSTLR